MLYEDMYKKVEAYLARERVDSATAIRERVGRALTSCLPNGTYINPSPKVGDIKDIRAFVSNVINSIHPKLTQGVKGHLSTEEKPAEELEAIAA